MPDDRLTSDDAEKKLPKPEVYIVRNGEAVFKPGMKTWVVETRESGNAGGSGTVHGQTGVVVGGTVCTCDQVCTCNKVCSCQTTCTCQTTCSCQKTCSCQSTGGTYCSCNKVCSCVPVH